MLLIVFLITKAFCVNITDLFSLPKFTFNLYFSSLFQILSRTKKLMGYNQDCKSMIYKLLNHGCDEAALAVFNSMTPIVERVGGAAAALPGGFFVRHMVKCQMVRTWAVKNVYFVFDCVDFC